MGMGMRSYMERRGERDIRDDKINEEQKRNNIAREMKL